MNDSQKIAFLCCVHRWDDTRVLHKEAAHFARSGYEATVVAPGESRKSWKQEEQGVEIITFKKVVGLLGRLRNMLRALAIVRLSGFDVLHCCEVEAWIVGVWHRLFNRHVKVVFDVHEVYSHYYCDRFLPAGTRTLGVVSIRLFFRIMTLWTDLLVFAKLGAQLDFRRIRCDCVFALNYVEKSRLQIRPNESDATSKWFAVHVGVFARERGWPQLLEALSLTKNRGINVLLLGTINEGKEELLKEARRLGVEECITIIEQVPYAEVFDYLAKCTVGLMLYQPGFVNHVYAFPLKLYDYMAVGLPVIAPDFSLEVIPVIEEVGNGILVDSSSSQAIANALDKMFEERQEYEERGKRGPDAIVENYNWDEQFQGMRDSYEKMFAS
ncbi:glycosyltransferase family 4 protein [Verrucomicrobia bacterium]|nr:glycosyltransferase family 4 protein [Verrucomicrobiota bacterium]